jgi:DNA-directed RNA polymerase subunit RPC12/RpoP
MMENWKLAEDPLTSNQRRRCPHCAALSCLTHSLLDSRNGTTVRVYQCIACGKRIWDDVPRFVLNLH